MNSSTKDRELFSVKSKKSKKSNKVYKDIGNDADDERYDEEQITEIKKLQEKTRTFKESLSKRKVIAEGKFTYEMLVPGLVLSACVTRVSTECIIVSLPFRLMGYIPLTSVSKEYSTLMQKVASNELSSVESFHTLPELYKEGQFITVSVTSNKNNKSNDRLTPGACLSLFPSDVNGSVSSSSLHDGAVLQCAVTSVEDHGYVLDLGVKGVKACFLPSENAPSDYTIDVGSVLQCSVVSIHGSNNATSITMSALPATVATTAARVTPLRVPGSSVDCIVAKSSANGLVVFVGSEEEYEELLDNGGNALAGTVGHVSKRHLRGAFDQCHVFRQGQKIQGKVLFVTEFPKICYITLNKNVMNYNLPADYDPKHGLQAPAVIPEASILLTSPQGLYVRLSDKCLGFCHYKKIGDCKSTKPKSLMKNYPVGTRVACRLVAFNYIDQLFLLNMTLKKVKEEKEEQVSGPKLTIGDVVRVAVISYENGGAKVKTEDTGINGYVRENHITDTMMPNPERKVPIGHVRDAKLIEITSKEHEDGKITYSYYFSFKTRIVESDIPLLSEYSEENVGAVAIGVIVKVSAKNIFLVFGQNVRGFLPSNVLPPGYTLSKIYEVGTAIKIRVMGFKDDESQPTYVCGLPSVGSKRKRTLTS